MMCQASEISTLVRAAVTVSAFLSLGCTHSEGSPPAKANLKALIIAVIDGSEKERQAAGREITRLRLPEAIPAIVASRREASLGVTFSDTLTLAGLEAWPVLDEGLGQEELYERLLDAAAWITGTELRPLKNRRHVISGDPRLSFAESLLDSDNVVIRYFAIACLFRVQCPTRAAWIRESITSVSPAHKEWVEPLQSVILKAYEPESINRGLRSGETWAIAWAASSGSTAYAHIIMEELGKGTARNTEDLVWALGEMRSKEAVPVLLKLMVAGNYWTSADAVEALAKVGDATVVPHLRAAIGSASTLTKAEIILALGKMGSASDLSLLQEYASQPHSRAGGVDLRSCAESAIQMIKLRAQR